MPVVLASSVDALLSHYPVIRLQSWEELEKPGAMLEWSAQIRERFGEEPFGAQMRRRLTSSHWARRIREKHAAALGKAHRGFDPSPRMP